MVEVIAIRIRLSHFGGFKCGPNLSKLLDTRVLLYTREDGTRNKRCAYLFCSIISLWLQLHKNVRSLRTYK